MKTGQTSIASVLAPRIATKINGLSDEKQRRLGKNWLMLIQVIEPIHGGLLSAIMATGCITRHQKQFVESATSVMESNARILNKLIRGSEQDYSKFIDCLNKTGQPHVASILSERFEVFQVPIVD
jgi:hypothetical protein